MKTINRALDGGAIAGREIQGPEIDFWNKCQLQNSNLASPFFSHGLFVTVAKTKTDVRILRIAEGDRTTAILPLQVVDRVGVPYAWFIQDSQGFIAPPSAELDTEAAVREAGLDLAWFDQLDSSQAEAYTEHLPNSRHSSLRIRPKATYKSYVESTVRSHRRYKQMLREEKRLCEEHGELSFTFRNHSPGDFNTFLALKKEHHPFIGNSTPTQFEVLPWLEEFMRELSRARVGDFEGVFSTLHCGGELIAAHLGMRQGKYFALWFPAYDRKFSKYGVGNICLSKCIASAFEHGAEVVEFGFKGNPYKEVFTNEEFHQFSAVIRGNPTLETADVIHRVNESRRGCVSPKGRHLY